MGEKRDSIENWGTNAHLNFLHFVNAIVDVEGSPFRALATDVEDKWPVLDNALQETYPLRKGVESESTGEASGEQGGERSEETGVTRRELPPRKAKGKALELNARLVAGKSDIEREPPRKSDGEGDDEVRFVGIDARSTKANVAEEDVDTREEMDEVKTAIKLLAKQMDKVSKWTEGAEAGRRARGPHLRSERACEWRVSLTIQGMKRKKSRMMGLPKGPGPTSSEQCQEP